MYHCIFSKFNINRKILCRCPNLKYLSFPFVIHCYCYSLLLFIVIIVIHINIVIQYSNTLILTMKYVHCGCLASNINLTILDIKLFPLCLYFISCWKFNFWFIFQFLFPYLNFLFTMAQFVSVYSSLSSA